MRAGTDAAVERPAGGGGGTARSVEAGIPSNDRPARQLLGQSSSANAAPSMRLHAGRRPRKRRSAPGCGPACHPTLRHALRPRRALGGAFGNPRASGRSRPRRREQGTGPQGGRRAGRSDRRRAGGLARPKRSLPLASRRTRRRCGTNLVSHASPGVAIMNKEQGFIQTACDPRRAHHVRRRLGKNAAASRRLGRHQRAHTGRPGRSRVRHRCRRR